LNRFGAYIDYFGIGLVVFGGDTTSVHYTIFLI
jgi:hypothetical protein